MRVAASADLIDDREYAAPPELVFEAWTKAEHFARWFAPDNVEVPLCGIDARPGGVIRFEHRWPEGQLGLDPRRVRRGRGADAPVVHVRRFERSPDGQRDDARVAR